jgi:hypothetical protein
VVEVKAWFQYDVIKAPRTGTPALGFIAGSSGASDMYYFKVNTEDYSVTALKDRTDIRDISNDRVEKTTDSE